MQQELDVEAIERDLRALEQHKFRMTESMLDAGVSEEKARRAREMRLRDARQQLEIAKRFTTRARLERDFRYAKWLVASKQARNEFIRAQRKLIEFDAKFAAAFFDVVLPEEKITMTWRQVFLARAHSYATNEQLADALLTTPAVIRVDLNELRKLSDEDYASMGFPFRMPSTLKMR